MTTAMTLAACRDLLPNEELKDHVVTGLSLRAGMRAKSWMLLYRARNRKVRRPKLGTFPSLGIEAAREAAREILKRVAMGDDPANEWRVDRKAATMAQLCDEYMAWAKARKLTWKNDDRMLTRFIRSQPFADALVKDVTVVHIDALLADVTNMHPRFPTGSRGGHHRVERAPIMANRFRQVLHKMFELAVSRFKMREDGRNPVKDALIHSENKRRRYAAPDELRRLALALDEMSRRYPREMAAIWVMFLTGGRVNEIALARADQRVGDTLVLAKHKTAKTTGAPRVIHLPRPALDILNRVPPRNGYLFTGKRVNWIWAKVLKLAGIGDLQLRDARRSFASVALSHGKSLDQIGGLLGHESPQTTKRYSYLMDGDAARAANETGGQMAALMQPSVQPPQALLPAPSLPRARPAMRVRPRVRTEYLF